MQTNIPLVATNFVVSGSLHILVADAVTVIRFYNYNCKYLHTYSNYRCKKKIYVTIYGSYLQTTIVLS